MQVLIICEACKYELCDLSHIAHLNIIIKWNPWHIFVIMLERQNPVKTVSIQSYSHAHDLDRHHWDVFLVEAFAMSELSLRRFITLFKKVKEVIFLFWLTSCSPYHLIQYLFIILVFNIIHLPVLLFITLCSNSGTKELYLDTQKIKWIMCLNDLVLALESMTQNETELNLLSRTWTSFRKHYKNTWTCNSLTFQAYSGHLLSNTILSFDNSFY